MYFDIEMLCDIFVVVVIDDINFVFDYVKVSEWVIVYIIVKLVELFEILVE